MQAVLFLRKWRGHANVPDLAGEQPRRQNSSAIATKHNFQAHSGIGIAERIRVLLVEIALFGTGSSGAHPHAVNHGTHLLICCHVVQFGSSTPSRMSMPNKAFLAAFDPAGGHEVVPHSSSKESECFNLQGVPAIGGLRAFRGFRI